MNSLQKELLRSISIPSSDEDIIGEKEQLQEVLMKYSCAIKEVKTKLEVLNNEFTIKKQRNPIEIVTTRVKTPSSIVEKLKRRGFEVSIQSLIANLNDVAGIRVICSFVDDIYAIAEMLTKQDDVTLIRVKDYIKNPKPNGYRSLHLIIEIPVFFSDEKDNIKVEVQIRTIAMDFWATLEHQLQYKQEEIHLPDIEEIKIGLKDCANIISNTDVRMMELRDRIEYLKLMQKREGNVEKED